MGIKTHKVQGLIKKKPNSILAILLACANEKKRMDKNEVQWRRFKRMGNFSGIACTVLCFLRVISNGCDDEKWKEGRWQKREFGAIGRLSTLFHTSDHNLSPLPVHVFRS